MSTPPPSAAARSPPTARRCAARRSRARRVRDARLPAHPGEEITAEVLYGERQRIWDQAENRRHAQKALLELLIDARRERRADAPAVSRTRPQARPDDELQAAAAVPARPQRGDELELEIDRSRSAARASRAWARRGYVVFVAGAIPGDRVRAVVHKRKRSLRARAHARGAEREPRADPAACSAPGRALAGAPLRAPARVKRAQVDEALRRIGQLDGFALEEIVPALEQWRYATSSSTPSATRRAPERWCAASTRPERGTWSAIEDCMLASTAAIVRQLALEWCRSRAWGVGARAGRHGREELADAQPAGAGAASQPRGARGTAHRRAAGAAGHDRRRARRGRARRALSAGSARA